jgi:HEAT repeats
MRAALCGALILVAGALARADPPLAVNARILTRPASPDLAAAVAAVLASEAGPAWIGYSVPTLTERAGVTNGGWSERCRLEQSVRSPVGAQGSAGPIRLEPSPTVMVLMRVTNHAIEKVRSFSSDCQIDAGGLSLFWFESVSEPDSVAFLKSLVADAAPRDRSDQALAAIAAHRHRAAGLALLDFAKNGQSSRTRQRALLFIARRADADAASIISQAIEQDGDAEVKRQAVFALSQLPSNQGVPLLITLARTTKNPTVRRQALVFLGQSKDPRALSYLEEILR